jgi:AraC family transcriptional regulator, exoenzyme S synthesis regulatory protein ExsA
MVINSTMLKILPQLFYETPEYQKILVDGLSSIIHKKVHEPVFQKEGYVSVHAITLVLKGTYRLENENGPLAVVKENQMVFIPKGLYQVSDILPEKGSFEAIVFFFDEEVITQYLKNLKVKPKKEKCITHFLFDYNDDIRLYTESLLKLYGTKDKMHKKFTSIKLMELLHLITESNVNLCFPTTLNSLNNKERKGIRAFMEANFSKPLGIEDYAYLTGRSLSSFRRDFKTQYGISPKQWLIDKRLEKAHGLLARNNTTVYDVVLETGYENMSHFIKAFHKRYGIPPKQFLIKKRKEVLV